LIKKVVASVLLLVLLAVVIVQAMEPEEQQDNLPGLNVGEKAPDFELQTLSGESVKLSDFQGKKVMLNFWATWCPPCKEEMPDMEQFHHEKGKDMIILAVNIDPQLNVKQFVTKMGITFPILLDEKDKVNTLYQVLTIPTTYFIDEKGIIRQKYLTAMTQDVMEQYMNEM
jgi:peroxiredoxin